MRWLVLVFLVPLRLAVAEEPPQAGPVAKTDPELLRRLEALEQRNTLLENKLKLAEENQANENKKRIIFNAAPGEGLTLKLPDERFSMIIRARAQIRDSYVVQKSLTLPATHTNEINVKTVRLYIGGNVLTPYLTYGIQLAFGGNDFEKDSASPIFDAWINYAQLRYFNIKVGQYFVPFDRSRTIREFALELVDRAPIVTELSLDRDVGVTFWSDDVFNSAVKLGYAVFVGGGDGKNRFGGASEGPLVTARLVLRPFGNFNDDIEGDLRRDRRPRLAIGIAGGYNHDTVRNRSTLGDTLVLGGFNYVHADADVVFKCAGFYFLGEFLYRQGTQNHHEGNNPTTGARINEFTRSGYGYFLQAGQMLSRRTEIAARWEQLFAHGATDPALIKQVANLGKNLDVGFNYYLNGHLFKIQADYLLSFGDEIAAARHSVRVQLDATF